MPTNPQRPEVDDPRVLALAKARQQIAYESPFNFVCPPWDGLSEQERHLSLLDARNYLCAAIDAGLVPAVVSSPPATDRATLRDRVAEAIASCPGRELSPNPCRCPCYGCKHHCAAHDPSSVADMPAAWIDGHPQLEAIASAVYERCETGDGGIVHDDPRNIAVAALKGLLGPGDRDDARPEPIVTVHAAPDLSPAAAEALSALADVAKQQMACDFEHPHPEHPCGRRLPDTETQDASTAPLAAGLPLVQGACPACHSASLFLGNGGYVTCSQAACPEPDAATSVLERRTVTLSPPEGPEYTPCLCGHIEPEHEADRGACLTCDCEAYRPCTCASAGDAFVPAGHYTDCPQADHPAGGAGGVADETGEGGDRLVAHVLATGTDLHCLRCAPPPYGDIWAPVIADELEDGGVCVRCGVDVLIPQEERRG